MRPFRVRHRPDGVIELRRRSLRDIVVTRDAAVLILLFGGSLAFMSFVATMLVTLPALVVACGAVALVNLWQPSAGREARLAVRNIQAVPPTRSPPPGAA